MASEHLRRKVVVYTRDLIAAHGRTNKLPATIIGAEYAGMKKVDCSGRAPTPLSNSLEDALLKIAPIGTKGKDNYVGCCCEVRASNQILQRRIAPLKNIQFTDAIRPRTNQVISRCLNCQTVFG